MTELAPNTNLSHHKIFFKQSSELIAYHGNNKTWLQAHLYIDQGNCTGHVLGQNL